MEIEDKIESLVIELNTLDKERAFNLVNKYFKGFWTKEGDLDLEYFTDEEEFTKWIGRKPNEGEIRKFATILTKIADDKLDWENILTEAKEEFEK